MTAPAPIVRGGTTVRISEHVHVIPDGGVPRVPNVGFVVGSEALLVIDTGMGARNGRTVLEEARALSGGRRLLLVTTHTHPEHDLGAHVFPDDTEMIRSRTQVDEIAETGLRVADDFSRETDAQAELLQGARFRDADVVFDGEHRLELGGVTVRLIALGANHTPGDTVAVVEEDGVLFSGDIAMRGAPSFASERSSLRRWLASLDTLEALHPTIIVPSHGPLGDASMIADYRDYLTDLGGRVAEAKAAGRDLAATTAAVLEAGTRFEDAARVSGAVRAAYAEA